MILSSSATENDPSQTKTRRPRRKVVDRTEEDSKFRCDPSVFKWRSTETYSNDVLLKIAQETAQLTSKSLSNPLERAYWSSSALRTLFFWGGTLILPGSFSRSARLYEVLLSYMQELEFVKSGSLRYPWDFAAQPDTGRLLELDHRQMKASHILPKLADLVTEAAAIMDRRETYGGLPARDNKPVPAVESKSASSTTKEGSSIYPRYYLNDFHYQTDGWLSARSAERYEFSSEAIFVGGQDIMQRQTILPLVQHFSGSSGSKASPENILEVACGTGRFATFVRDQFPQADYTLTDLSPYYLDKARENDAYWRSYRGDYHCKNNNNLRELSPAEIVQAKAEALPFPDNSFDAVVCVYLFHELPAPIRAQAAREMARVLRPGGTVVWSDSIQIGDREAFSELSALSNFTTFNEPHSVSYLYDDVAAYFEQDAGLVCGDKHINSRTKTLSFVKK